MDSLGTIFAPCLVWLDEDVSRLLRVAQVAAQVVSTVLWWRRFGATVAAWRRNGEEAHGLGKNGLQELRPTTTNKKKAIHRTRDPRMGVFGDLFMPAG